MIPSYIKLLENNEFPERIHEIEKYYSDGCAICPVECNIKRDMGETGQCGVSSEVMVSSWNIHNGEEPPISGVRGSGTIFFTGCNLKCIFCQNYPISQLLHGEKYTIDELSDMMLELQEKGAHNINFVTPTHFTFQIVKAVKIAAEKGLHIPLVWNSNGYEKLEVIKLLKDVVDIYLPDMKFISSENSDYVSGRKDYFVNTLPVIKEMFDQVGLLKISSDGIAYRGVLLRHLVLPDDISDSCDVIDYARSISSEMNMSIMSQYFPAHLAVNDNRLKRRIFKEEYDEILEYVKEKKMENIFIQEL